MDSDSGGAPRTQLACGVNSFDCLWKATLSMTSGEQLLSLLVESTPLVASDNQCPILYRIGRTCGRNRDTPDSSSLKASKSVDKEH